jgi:hypothetical protein
VEAGGTLGFTNLLLNGGGWITNSGGIFQVHNPDARWFISTNGTDQIILTNGAFAWRNVASANVFNSQLSNLTYQGVNCLMLRQSTNTSVSYYKFDTNNSLLFNSLCLQEGNPVWQATLTEAGPGGFIRSTNNTRGFVFGLVTNYGAPLLPMSTMIFTNTYVINGNQPWILKSSGNNLQFSNLLYNAGTVTISNWTGTAGLSGTGAKVFSQTNPGAPALAAMTFAGYAAGADYISGGEIVPAGGAPVTALPVGDDFLPFFMR